MISTWIMNILLAAGISFGVAGIITAVRHKEHSGNIFAIAASMMCVSALYCVIRACGPEIQESPLIKGLVVLGACLQITLCNLLIFDRKPQGKNVKKR